jgi:hypothetical protein
VVLTSRPLVPSAEQLPGPLDHLALDLERAIVAAAGTGVHRRADDLGEQPARGAGAMYPAEEAWMGVAGRVGQDRAQRALDGRGSTPAFDRQRRLQRGARSRRHRLPDRPLADVAQMIDRVVELPVGARLERVPVGGIEAGGSGS